MRRFLLSIAIFLALTASANALSVGDEAPDFQYTTLKGKNVSYIAQFKNKKPLYIIFWASW